MYLIAYQETHHFQLFNNFYFINKPPESSMDTAILLISSMSLFEITKFVVYELSTF